MTEQELTLGSGTLRYTIQNGPGVNREQTYVVVTGFTGLESEIMIPSKIEGVPVTAISKKAFLSKKMLRKVILPDTITKVEDWAFAYCDSLETVEFPDTAISFGRAVFLDCKALACILIRGKEEAVGRLLATAVVGLDAAYLCDLSEAGKKEWLTKFDARLLSVMHLADEEGYSKQVLCGEEDYGSTDLNAFLSGKRMTKVRLAFLRLLCDIGILEETREELSEYLKSHTKGCASEETWQVLLKEHGEDREYHELFTGLGCVTNENLDGMLTDIGDTYPELKAYLLKYKQEELGFKDFFDDLIL